MALVLLPGLSNLIEDISEEKKLAPQVVEAALREALLKGYERYRRTLYLGISEDPFDEEYFSNFDAVNKDISAYIYTNLRALYDSIEFGHSLGPFGSGDSHHYPFLQFTKA